VGVAVKKQIEKFIVQMVDTGVFFQDAVSEFEKQFIRKVLENHGGNRSSTAKALGIHRNTLGRKIEEYHLVASNGSKAKTAPATRKKPTRK
jgi:transcriptional regulator with PAS, ATPase and Fis domain